MWGGKCGKNENKRLVEGKKMQYENSRLVKREKKMVVVKKIWE